MLRWKPTETPRMGRIATKASPEKINSEQKNSSDHKLTLVLQAIADPARRKILTALKEKGACSIDKSTGLCASDIEMRLHVAEKFVITRFVWRAEPATNLTSSSSVSLYKKSSGMRN